MTNYLPAISEAALSIKPYIVKTPLVHSQTLSDRFGFPTFLKLENMQVTGAFKVRGAMNKALALKASGKDHMVAASSGSHAIGVSLSAQICGMKATVIMPTTSPELKRQRVLSYGAKLIIEGLNFDDSLKAAEDLAESSDAVLVSGIEDEQVIAGPGSIGLEILGDLPEVDFVAVPIGGGGMISGVLAALKETRQEIQVWGVEATGAASMAESLKQGRLVELPHINTVADAIAVRKPGKRPFSIVKEYADGVVTVDDSDMIKEVGRLALWEKIVAEPAAAAALAVNWDDFLKSKPKAAVFVITGGNIEKELLLKAISETDQ